MTARPGDAGDRGGRLALLGWGVGALFFFYAWVLRVSPSIMTDELMRDFALGGAALGHLSALYFYAYAGLQIPVGVLLDRFGPRRLMTLAALVCSGGSVLFAVSETLLGASLGRLLIGGGAAFSLVGALAVAGQWFPARRFALLGGLAMMTGMAGGVFGQAPMRVAVDAVGWRSTLLVTGLAGALIVAGAWLLVRDRHRGTGGVGALLSGLRRVTANRQTWLNAVAGLGATGPLLGFASLWGVPFVVSVYGIDRAGAAGIVSLTILGWGIGAPVFGWLSDHWGLRRPPLLIGVSLSLVSLSAVVYAPGLPLGVTGALCFLIGFGGSGQIVNFALVREHNPPALSGTAIGVLNGMVVGAGALFQPSVGWILDTRWDGRLSEGARVYSVGDYRVALTIVVVGCAVGLLSSVLLRESYCRQQAG